MVEIGGKSMNWIIIDIVGGLAVCLVANLIVHAVFKGMGRHLDDGDEEVRVLNELRELRGEKQEG